MSGMQDFLRRSSGILSIWSRSLHPGPDLLLVCGFTALLLRENQTDDSSRMAIPIDGSAPR